MKAMDTMNTMDAVDSVAEMAGGGGVGGDDWGGMSEDWSSVSEDWSSVSENWSSVGYSYWGSVSYSDWSSDVMADYWSVVDHWGVVYDGAAVARHTGGQAMVGAVSDHWGSVSYGQRGVEMAWPGYGHGYESGQYHQLEHLELEGLYTTADEVD